MGNGENAVARKKLEQPSAQKSMADRLLENDESAVAEFREFLSGAPEFVELYGNPSKWVEDTLIRAVSGRSLLERELLTARVAALRAELAGPHPSPVERLLVERVVACWLQVYHADRFYYRTEDLSLSQGDYYQRRQDRAHRRLLFAIKTLATVRRLALPIRVNMDVNVAGAVEVETKPAEPALPPGFGRMHAPAVN